MCLLICKPAGAPIEEILDECSSIDMANPDGFGAAWHDGQSVRIMRGMVSVAAQRKAIKKLDDYECLLHWRYGTSGRRNKSNCHPFRLADGSALAHNGIITDPLCAPDRRRSDTAQLARLAPDASTLLRLCRDELDISGSKIAVMASEGEIEIVGEDRGIWEDGVWWSNLHHRIVTPRWWDTPVEIAEPADLDQVVADLIERHGMRAVIESIEKHSY